MDNIIQAIEQIRRGGMVVVRDDDARENEGDLIAAAELITPESITFMARQGCGLICLALSAEQVDHLKLPLMVAADQNSEQQRTAFTLSIDAAKGITTGISASDRAKTILLASDPNTRAEDLSRPGHIFPLRAENNGVLDRAGHTEAAVDLARLAGLKPAGVICEIMAEDGNMMRGPELMAWAQHWQLPFISIAELMSYRQKIENQLQSVVECQLPTSFGAFKMKVYEDQQGAEEAIVLTQGDDFTKASVRIHSECITGDVFGSLRCDCGEQLQQALRQLAQEEAGILIYLRQEGRGIGLANKIRSYALQEQGLDTVEANHALGFQNDLRQYELAVAILKELGVEKINLMSNNPEKMAALAVHWPKKCLSRTPIWVKSNKENVAYLQTKRQKMGHLA